ncbi:unnamed protein product, partial [Ectocarpus sp. 13 AM-2016]
RWGEPCLKCSNVLPCEGYREVQQHGSEFESNLCGVVLYSKRSCHSDGMVQHHQCKDHEIQVDRTRVARGDQRGQQSSGWLRLHGV